MSLYLRWEWVNKTKKPKLQAMKIENWIISARAISWKPQQ